MTDNFSGLAATIQKLKKAVKDELENLNGDFHSALNSDDPLKFYGLGSSDERSTYLVDPSDVLFWHDPTAYMDELERWESQLVSDKHSEVKAFLKDSEQYNSFARLVESIKRKRVSPFVGAGLSAPNDYPLWGQALKKLVRKLEGVSESDKKAMLPELPHLEEIKKHIDNYRYLAAAQILYEHHRTQLERFILDSFDGADAKAIIGPITLLPRLTDGCIITTNFDGLIEKVFHNAGRAIQGYMHGTQPGNQFAAKLIQGNRCILKLHGNFDSPDTYIFSESQYNSAYGAKSIDYARPLAKTLRQIFISHSMLFLGCSLEQDRTLNLFMDVAASDTFDIPEHFALLPEPGNHLKKMEKENILTRAKIRPLWYRVITDDDGNQDHSQLGNFLEFAIDCAMGKAKV